jgi:hypothetical protein
MKIGMEAADPTMRYPTSMSIALDIVIGNSFLGVE